MLKRILPMLVIAVLLVGCIQPTESPYPTPTESPYPSAQQMTVQVTVEKEEGQMSDFLSIVWGVLQVRLPWLGLLIVLDIIFGVIVAFKNKAFSLEKLTSFLYSDILPAIVYAAIVLITSIPEEAVPSGALIATQEIIYAGVFLKILTSLLASFAALGVATDALLKIGVNDKRIASG